MISRLFVILFVLITHLATGQDVHFSGFVVDSSSGERLIGASVFSPELQKGTHTDGHGYFSLKMRQNSPSQIIVSYLGYEKKQLTFEVLADTVVILKLETLLLPELTIQANKKRIRHGLNTVTISSPSFLPYPSLKTDIDILDVIKQLPGVQPGLEGSSGFSVRGGNNDQNLIQMDHIPLYNVAHLANFISIFDPYVINSMTLHKGGFPAYYGGRASSVLDVYLKEGNKSDFGGEVILGPIFVKVALEGPIVKDKTSYLFSLRRSITDLLMKGAYQLIKPETEFLYAFHDLNFKLSHNFKAGSDLYLSFYTGRDNLTTEGERSFRAGDDLTKTYLTDIANSWGNTSVSLRWTKVLNKSLLFNSVVAYSHFNYQMGSEDAILDNGHPNQHNLHHYRASVNDLLIKNELDWQLRTNVNLKTGIHLTRHFFEPVRWMQERSRLGGAFQSSTQSQVRLNGTEGAFFIQSKIDLMDDRLTLYPGIRAGFYALDNVFTQPLWEPRFRSAWHFSDNSQAMLSFSRMNQTVHSLNTSGVALMPDIWIPATERLKPSSSDEVSLAWDRFFEKTGLSGQLGLYYRNMKNLIQYDGNTGFTTIQDQWDESIMNAGEGYAYGFEIALDKSFKRFQLDGNYTFYRSFRRFDQLNEGEYFPHIFDRPHNLTLTGAWKINEKTTFSALWTYQTGQPITFGTELFPAINNHYYQDFSTIANGFLVGSNSRLATPYRNVFEQPLLLSEINNFRMPDFHRLDVSISHEKPWKNGKVRKLNISVYNAYNRQNPYFIYAVREQGKIGFKMLTMFPVLPSVSYGVRF